MPESLKLQLVLAGYDETAFVPALEAAQAAGLVFTTLAALGDTLETRRKLFELNRECSADIPERGEFYTWDDYQRLRIDVPSFRAGGVVLALDGDTWVGMSVISDRAELGYALVEITGLRRPYRGRGIATAMKVCLLRIAREWDVPKVVTMHHLENAPAIASNRRLGFVEADW